jgi:hypothetical protein
MSHLSGADWALLAAGAFLAVVTLARLMAAHRQAVMLRLRDEIEQQQRANKQHALQAAQAAKAGEPAKSPRPAGRGNAA